MSSSATLRDVADMAGVSIGTASQAINNRPNVAPDTRARVLDAALALGYQTKVPPPVVDPPLSIVGMLTKNDYGLPITANVFYSYVQAGVESECRKRNIGLIYSTVIVDQQNHPINWPSMISEQRIDGLILIGIYNEGPINLPTQRPDIPIVLVDSYSPKSSYDSVLTDNKHGTSSAVNYLISQGHSCIGLIGSNQESPPSVMERRCAYIDTLKLNGIREIFIQDSHLSIEAGYEATKKILKRSPQITALFACNDEVAIGALRAARDMSLDVPNDLSVIGFDDTDLAKNVTPALTTVHVHKTWLGAMGLRLLVDRAQNPDRPRVDTVLSTQLIVRDTVRSLKLPVSS